ncbi:MAG: hypothetical protein QNJ64_11230 [Crocosphaera sp.]|nr:hypothetical protein [Crocosphaera sp.]
MKTAELRECYGDIENLQGEEQNYFLMRLTSLYGEECLSFLDEDEEQEEEEEQKSEN